MENNRKIAKFMGWSTHPKYGDQYLINKCRDRVLLPWYSECNTEANIREFNYNSDWNMLIPAIKELSIKMEESSFKTDIFKRMILWIILNNISDTYKCFTKALEYHNKQKEK